LIGPDWAISLRAQRFGTVRVQVRQPTLVLTVVLAALSLAGCGLVPATTPEPSTCGGISADFGPCGSAPDFKSDDCGSLASEYGSALDQALLEVLRGPADVGGEAKSVRLLHTEAVVTAALTNRMVQVGLIEKCTMPAFLDAAETGFSKELRAGVGHALFDGQPDATYQEFRTLLAKMMSGIGTQPSGTAVRPEHLERPRPGVDDWHRPGTSLVLSGYRSGLNLLMVGAGPRAAHDIVPPAV
jgi:hypothetical protein